MSDDSDFQKAVHSYESFKLLLARCVGFVAIAYGIFTFNAYFFVLGIAAVGLFWMWDRTIARNAEDHNDHVPPQNPAEDSN